MINIAFVAEYCRGIRVARRKFLGVAVVCSASLMVAGCYTNSATVVPEPIVQAPPEIEPPVSPPEPDVAPPVVRLSPRIVPNSTALFFDESDSRKNLVLRNLGNGAGEFSFRVPKEAFTTGRESVTFTPASGTVPAGETATVTVEVQRSDESCARVLRLAILQTAQGTRNIGVNYSNTGRAILQIDKSGVHGRHFEPDSNVIDFAAADGSHVEFTVANRGCIPGTLTLLKSGPHEAKLLAPVGSLTVAPGEHQVIRLRRPRESFFIGTHSVTLLVRQDGATVDNVVVRWPGLSLLR